MKCGTIESCIGCPLAPEFSELLFGDETSVSLGEMANRLRWQMPLDNGVVEASFALEGILSTEERVEAVKLAAGRIGTSACKDKLYKGEN